MSDDVERLMALADHALAAWDQYNIQRRLTDDPAWFDQAHHWDRYNNGHRAPQMRRDPVLMSRVWNDLEKTLREMTCTAEWIRGRRGAVATAEAAAPEWADRRTGPFDAVAPERRRPAPEPVAAAVAARAAAR